MDNNDDIIDTRDLIALVDDMSAARDENELDDDELAELESLERFATECLLSFSDYREGETLVRDSYFKDYAQELAEDVGAIKRDAEWPHTCIDWEWAARELRMDYTAVDWDGVTYWGRA